jgi:hypothetical protein
MTIENNLYRDEKQELRAKSAFSEIKITLINHPVVKAVMQSTEFAGIDEREDIVTFYVDEITAFTLVRYSGWGCFFQAIHEAQSSSDFIYIPFHGDGIILEDIGCIVKKFEPFVSFDLYYRVYKKVSDRKDLKAWELENVNSFPRENRKDYEKLPAKQKLPKSNDGIEYGVIVRDMECPGKFSSEKIMVLKLGQSVFDPETFIV